MTESDLVRFEVCRQVCRRWGREDAVEEQAVWTQPACRTGVLKQSAARRLQATGRKGASRRNAVERRGGAMPGQESSWALGRDRSRVVAGHGASESLLSATKAKALCFVAFGYIGPKVFQIRYLTLHWGYFLLRAWATAGRPHDGR